jgi:RNA polymerase sigma-70 factor (ECF subfamily)
MSDSIPSFSGHDLPADGDPRSNSEILAAVALGDRRAFRVLYDRFAGRLLAYVRAMGGPRVEAEDVVQEVLVAIWSKAGQYRPALGSPEGWIFTVTRNKVFDIWRQRFTVEGMEEVDLEMLAIQGPGTDPTLVVTLTKALSTLPPEQRQPLVLAYFGGLTYGETAKRLGLPEGTVKSRIRSAHCTLKLLVATS